MDFNLIEFNDLCDELITISIPEYMTKLSIYFNNAEYRINNIDTMINIIVDTKNHINDKKMYEEYNVLRCKILSIIFYYKCLKSIDLLIQNNSIISKLKSNFLHNN